MNESRVPTPQRAHGSSACQGRSVREHEREEDGLPKCYMYAIRYAHYHSRPTTARESLDGLRGTHHTN